MVKRIEENVVLIQERNQLLRRLDELNNLISENTNVYKYMNREAKMADENTVEPVAEKQKLSISERYAKTQELIAAGKTNSEIAKELGCSVTYVYNVRLGKAKSKVAQA